MDEYSLVMPQEVTDHPWKAYFQPGILWFIWIFKQLHFSSFLLSKQKPKNMKLKFLASFYPKYPKNLIFILNIKFVGFFSLLDLFIGGVV